MAHLTDTVPILQGRSESSAPSSLLAHTIKALEIRYSTTPQVDPAMFRLVRHVSLAVLVYSATSLALPAQEMKPPEGFVALFNGKDLKGWKVTEGGKEDVWGVEGGVLFAAGGGGGWLMTEEAYDNFELHLDFKMPRMGNSGVALRSPLQGDPAYVGMEVQLLDDANWRGLRPTQHTGSIYDVVPAAKVVTRPAGEWNSLRVVCNGRTVVIHVNDHELVRANLDDYKDHFDKHPGLTRQQGHVGLQSYNYRVEFRNIFLKKLK